MFPYTYKIEKSLCTDSNNIQVFSELMREQNFITLQMLEHRSRKDLAYFRKTSYDMVCLIYSWNYLETGFRDSLGYLGDASRESSDCLVDFYYPSLGGFIPLSYFAGLLYLERTKSRIGYLHTLKEARLDLLLYCLS